MAKPEFDNPDDEIIFNIINSDVIDKLKNDRKIMTPTLKQIEDGKRVDVPKDKQWNQRTITSRIMQGLQNGDNIQTISNSLFRIVGKNESSAIRNARTMVTSAENGGRLDSYKNLSSQGVVMKKIWEATADDRTRPSHIDIDGEEKDIEEKFSNGCQYPGDGNGPAEEVWQCRCAMGTHIIGFKRADGSISYVDYMPDRTIHEEQMEIEREKRDVEKAKPSVTLHGLEKPERPSRDDFNGNDEAYQNARDEYRKAREEWQKEVDRFVQASLPDEVMTMDEFEKWCEEHDIKIYNDISQVDPRAFTAYAERMNQLSQDFPQVMRFRELYDIPDEFKHYEFAFENTLDFIAEANHGFTFGSSGTNFEYLLSDQARDVSGHFRTVGDGTINQLFDHEFGHNWFDSIRHNEDRTEEGFQRRMEIERDLIKTVYGRDGMSEYATTNADELCAEAFSAWYGGEQTDFAKAFGEFFERWNNT